MASGPAKNETELTSTVGDVLSTSTKEEKGDTSDAIPTSSTDASTAATTPHLVSDDPISSTSSELDQNKSAMTQMSGEIPPEEDLLGISITNIATEKITEDVEDIVHDLESLLQGPFPAVEQDTKNFEQIKTLTEESQRKKETGEADIQTSDNSEAQHDVIGNIQQNAEEVESSETKNKVGIEEDEVRTVDKVCELVNQNIPLAEEHEQKELGTDVADCAKQDLKVTELIEDVAAELNKNVGDSTELSAKEADEDKDGLERQIEASPLSEDIGAKKMDHVSDVLDDSKDSNRREDNSELDSEVYENQPASLQSEIIQSDATQDIEDADNLIANSGESLNTTKEVDRGDQVEADIHLAVKTGDDAIDEGHFISTDVEANQVTDGTTVEDASAADESAKTASEDDLVEASVVATEDQHQEIPADEGNHTVDDLEKGAMDIEDPTKKASDDEAPTIDSNIKLNVDNEANTNPEDGTTELSVADQNTAGEYLIESSVEDEKKPDSIIETCIVDEAEIVNVSESPENNGEVPASGIMAGKETSSTNNENPTETQILEIDTVNANSSEAQQIHAETPIDSGTIESVDAQAEDDTNLTEVNQTEGELEKEDISEENVEENAQDSLVTCGEQDDATVEPTVAKEVSQAEHLGTNLTEVNQAERELEKEENMEEVPGDSVVTGGDELQGDTTVEATVPEDVSQVDDLESNVTEVNQTEEDLEKGDILEENTKEDVQNSVETGGDEVQGDTTVEATVTEDVSQAEDIDTNLIETGGDEVQGDTTVEATVTEVVSQAEDIDTNLTEVNQTKEELEKEAIFEENMEEVTQCSVVTGDDEVQGVTTVEPTVTENVSQNETEIEDITVQTEEMKEVGTIDEEIENLQMSEAAKLKESVEPDEDIGVEGAVSEDNTETVLEANQNGIAETLPHETEPSKEAAKNRAPIEPAGEEYPRSNKESEDMAELADGVIEHERDGNALENISKETSNESSQSIALAEPDIPVEETEDNYSEVPQEDNVTSTQEEADAESKYMGDVENAIPRTEVETVADDEAKAAVDALGAFINEGIDGPQNVPEEGIVSNDDVECVENKLQCDIEGTVSVPEDETEAAVKFLAVSVGENVESPSAVPLHEADIIPEYEETEAAVAALTSSETPYCHSPGIPDESVVYPDQDGEMKSLDGTVATSIEESNCNENINESVIADKEIVENQETAGAEEAMVNPNREIESEVASVEAELKASSISAEAIAIQNEEAINEEETRAAVEAVISLAGETRDNTTPDTTSEAIVSGVETVENKDEKEACNEMVAIDLTEDEELSGMEVVTASVENRDVEAITIPILEATDYKSPKSVGGATAVSFESEEEMEALALEPDESPPATKSSPLASIEEVEEPEEQESQALQDAKVSKMEQNTKKELEIEALKKAVESITDVSKVKGITTKTEPELNTEVVDNEAKTEAVSVSEVIMIQDVEQVVQNNASEVNAIESSGKSFETIKEVTSAVDTTNDIEKESIENLSQTVEAESSETSIVKEKESKKINERPRRGKKVTPDSKLEELSINVDLPEKEKPYSPKVTIKPIKVPDDEISTTSNSDNEVGKGCLKMTITKQSDNTHSILKICDSEPTGAETAHEEGHIPKLRIKSILPPAEQHSPKSKNKQTYSPTGSSQRSSSPRVTIKPLLKPEVSPLKIKIGLKGDDGAKRASPKMNTKAVTDDDSKESVASPKKMKPTAKVVEDAEQLHSPRITIKPIPKHDAEGTKLRLKMHEEDENVQERSSPKITIKPLVKPQDSEEVHDDDEGAKERIVLKINKGNLPTKDDKSEKLAKITLKLSKEGGAHIVQQPEENQKRPNDEPVVEKNKKQKTEPKQHPVAEPAMETRSRHKEQDTVAEASKPNSTKHKDPIESPIEAKRSKLSPSPARDTPPRSKEVTEPEEGELKVIDARLDSPIVISEDSRSQDSGSCIIIEDTASEHSQMSFTPDSERKIDTEIVDCSDVTTPTSTPTPRKRGRPRKRRPADTPEVDPLLQPEEVPSPVQVIPPAAKQIATPKQIATTKQIATSKQIAASKQAAQAKQAAAAKAAAPKNVAPPTTEPSSIDVAAPVQALHESGRPKRSCRGQSAIDVLGIKPRKPRQPNAANPRGGGRGGKRTTAEVRSTVGGLEKDPKTPDAASPQSHSSDVILVRDLEVVVPAGDRNKTELKLQQVGKKVVEPPQRERRSAEPVQRERRSAERVHAEKEPPQKVSKTEEPVHKTRKAGSTPQVEKNTEPLLREKRSERRSAEPPSKDIKSVDPLRKEVKPVESSHRTRKSTELSPKEEKQIEPQSKLSKATEASTKRGASVEPLHKRRSLEPPAKEEVAKLEEPPHKQRKIAETTKTPLKELSITPQQKPRKSSESSPIEKAGELQPEGGPKKQNDPTEKEAKLADEVIIVDSTHEQSKDSLELTKKLAEPPQKDKVVQQKNPSLAPPRKLSTETPKRPGAAHNRERKSFPLIKSMLVEEIIDLDPDPPEPPKVAPVEIEARPIEVRVKPQLARRGGRRGIGGRRPTTERKVETVSEVEEKKSSSTETTPLPSPKPPSEKASTPATPQPKSPNPEVPPLEMPLPELTVHVTNIAPVLPSTSTANDVIMVDEETRMSADTNSRAQTPAKQVVSEIITIEESQSCSVQSTGNNSESGKTPSVRSNKAPRLEVQENESTSGISPDQLTEYYWNGNGPFMLQEQVAQYLGIKSFKRKYPGIMRRALDMQERDYIREKGLASDHMCDLGLTAVNSADILDIMYADFQDKYEEYCKNLRDRQAKELINKQKALSLAASHEKSKADITTQAVQSAAQWNANFNKARKEQRRTCMDLQTFTVNYPKGRMKPILKPKVGNYPVALVPGQFVDYFKEFTPTEINNLPLNTMLYDEVHRIPPDDSEDSGSESDSSSGSDSSSSSSGSDSSSGVEDCKLCKHSTQKKSPNANATANADPVPTTTPNPAPATITVPVTK